jgi:hypothetical protein
VIGTEAEEWNDMAQAIQTAKRSSFPAAATLITH